MPTHPPIARETHPAFDLVPGLPALVGTDSGHPAQAEVIPLRRHDADCTCPACRAGLAQALALDALGDYLEEEGPRLERMMRLLDRPGALDDLAALKGLHIDVGEEAAGLAEAAMRLERILDDLAEISTRVQLPMLIPAADLHLARNFDGAVRWVGARTQDLLAQARRAVG